MKSDLRLVYSPANAAWLSIFGTDTLNAIGPDNRRIFSTVQDFNDYCRATGTNLRACAAGGNVAPIISSTR